MTLRKDTQTRQLEIYSTAEQFFRQKGYLATNMREIADALGVQGASLYSHIGSKEEILWTIANRAADEFFAALEPVVATTESAPIKLRKAIVAHISVIARNLDAAAVYLNEWRHLGPRRRAQFAKRRDQYEALFRSLIREGVEAEAFAAVDEKFASLVMLSALNWTHQWYKPDGPMTAEEVGEAIADLLMKGLLKN